MHVVCFIPARGGSKRIPRKNLRTVGGIPLIARTIRTLQAAGHDLIIVSTDDHEIADVAAIWGAEVDVRPPEMAGDHVTIAQLVDEWLVRDQHDRPSHWPSHIETRVVVAQPTSPLLSPVSVAAAVDASFQSGHSIFTTFPERHMLWDDDMRMLNRARVNSTETIAPSVFRETGALVVFDPLTRIEGAAWPPDPPMMMSLDSAAEAIDVDDYVDLVRARAGAKPALIQFRYAESLEIGSGHRRRCETLAVELAGHHAVQVVDDAKVPLTSSESETVPDVVVMDVLDVPGSFIDRLRERGVKHIITLEDLGSGQPDMRINELYAPSAVGFYGPKYAVLRPEFQGHSLVSRLHSADGFTVVVTFGGTDPTGATERVVAELGKVSAITNLRIVKPPAFDGKLRVAPHEWKRSVGIQHDVLEHPCMASEFLRAHLVVCSSGRTVHEAVACGAPVIASAVNDRERMHAVCPGVIYLDDVDPVAIAAQVTARLGRGYFTDAGLTRNAREAYQHVDGLGAQRIAYLIDGLIGGLL